MKITERLAKKAVENRLPIISAFELLPMCNLACKMCYVRKSRKEVEEMGGLLSTEQWLNIAREARDAGLLFPLLTGGEPFLRSDIKEIIEGIQNMGMQVSINSNATLIDEEMAKWLSKHRPTRINITLYGASKESYKALCGDGSAYHKVIKAIDLLKSYGIPIKINFSVTPYNVQDIKQIIEYGHSVGAPVDIVTYMFPPIRRDQHSIGKNDRLTADQAGLARVQADFYQSEPAWFVGQARRYSYFVDVTDDMFDQLAKLEPHEMSCRAGRCSFWVDWQGNISNCGMYSSVKTSLKNKPLIEAWQYVVNETEKVRYSSVCTNCPNFRLCHACIAMVYNECGTIDGRPKYLCEMHKAASKYYQEYAKKLNIDIHSIEEIDLDAIRECDIDQL